MAKILAIVVLFVCALAAPQVLAQSDERPTLSAAEALIADVASISGGEVLAGIVLAVVAFWLVRLAIRVAVSIIWALLPLALFGVAGFIFYHKEFSDVDVPVWMTGVAVVAALLGVAIGDKQFKEDANEKQDEAQEHELVEGEDLEIKIKAARFETPLKDDLRKISAAVFSVMHEGHFSGFLIAKDADFSYALTNHVIGDKETFDIKRIGSDELATGSRIISSDGLNVALVAVNFTDVRPLRINTNLPEVGDDVYTIGSPVDTAFEGTLTRGVVGSIRENADGTRYIQSDVGIAPGSGGGPLLDKWGNVIGIFAMVMQHGDNPTPINLFIPIADALKHLGVKY